MADTKLKKYDSTSYVEIELYGLGKRKHVTLDRAIYQNEKGELVVKYNGNLVRVSRINSDVGDEKGYFYRGMHKAF